MIEMKKIGIVITLILFISGCAASSKTVRPSTAPEQAGAIIQEQVIPETLPVIQQPVAGPIVSQPTGITYSQITNLISEFIDIQPLETTSGEPRFLGASEDNLVTLEVTGDKANISKASMKLAYPKDIGQVNTDLNKAMLLRFLRNAVPGFLDWPSRISDMVNRFYSMESGTEEDDIVFEGNVIDILYDKDSGSITVTVRHE